MGVRGRRRTEDLLLCLGLKGGAGAAGVPRRVSCAPEVPESPLTARRKGTAERWRASARQRMLVRLPEQLSGGYDR